MTTKTFALIICEDHDFLIVKKEVVTVEVENHQQAMDYFIDKHHEELLGLTLMTFCFKDEAKKYGYKFLEIKK